MYKHIIRPIFFRISPEAAHGVIVVLMRLMHYIPGLRWLVSQFFVVHNPRLEREVFGLKFSSPVGMAAGFDKNGEVYKELGAFGFGFVEVGTVTPKAQGGNPKPRLFRLPVDGALINRMGFNNHGIDAAVHKLRHHKGKTIVGGNLGKNTMTPNEQSAADYLRSFRSLYEYVDYFVINISCPNVKNLTSLQNKDSVKDILSGLLDFRRGQNHYRPILLKISPDLDNEQIDDIIEVMIECGLDGVVATNTTTSRDGLKSSSLEVSAAGSGGLSGAPLTKRSLEVVRYIHEKTKGCFPIIGVGGIMTEDDAINMLKAGASLVQVYTGFIYQGPSFVRRICKRILAEKNLEAPSCRIDGEPEAEA